MLQLVWLPFAAYVLLPKVGLLGTLALLDRLKPAIELLCNSISALVGRSTEVVKQPRLANLDRYSLYALLSLAHAIACFALQLEPSLAATMAICASTLPAVQERLWRQLGWYERWRDRCVARLAAKLLVRAIRALSLSLLGEVSVLHSRELLPFVRQAPQLLWELCKHGGLTLGLLVLKRFSQSSYSRLASYLYYYQTSQLRRRPTVAEARRSLIALLNEQDWAKFAQDSRTFGLVILLFHHGEPSIPHWIESLNFTLARFTATWTLLQAVASWQRDWTAIGLLGGLLLIERRELSDYWKRLVCVTLAALLLASEQPLALVALAASANPLALALRMAARLLRKRLLYALQLRLPALWLLGAVLLLLDARTAGPLLLYAATLERHGVYGLLLLDALGWRSTGVPHILGVGTLLSAGYTLWMYAQRAPRVEPKVSTPVPFTMIESYSAGSEIKKVVG